MHALILNQHGIEEARYPVADADTLDPNTYADLFAASMGIELEPSKPGALIPDGCEDYRVTIQEEPGSVVCWASRNYIIAPEHN